MIGLSTEDLKISLLKTGDIFKITTKEGMMLNQLEGNSIDGSLNNIFLRVFKNEEILYTPLLGRKSKSKFLAGENCVSWKGEFEQAKYEVRLKTSKNCWFWEVEVEGLGDIEYDLVYTQDLGLGMEGAVKTNEAYTCQYIDHKVFSIEGYTICSRQNMPQGKYNPFLQQGSLSKIVSYSTDGFQFFGKNYRENMEIEALKNEKLANYNYQYEFAYSALALEKSKIALGEKKIDVFYAYFNPNLATAIENPVEVEEIKEIYNNIKDVYQVSEVVDNSFSMEFTLFNAKNLNEIEVENRYSNIRNKEYHNDELVSFFYNKGEHVVLKNKDMLVERAHGHILMNGDNNFVRKDIMTTTCYMNGVFNSQVSSGNTSFNILHTIVRNSLNLSKSSGQRIFIKRDDKLELLGEPSLFEMGLNYCRWIYVGEDEEIKVTTYTQMKEAEIVLEIESTKELEFVITNNIMEVQNYDITINKKIELVRRKSDFHEKVVYNFIPNQEFKNIIQEGIIDRENKDFLILETEKTTEFRMRMTAGEYNQESKKFEDAKIEYENFHKKLKRNFSLRLDGNRDIERLNDLIYWYCHNALVHFSVPHGLEQYSGAAWGTRDVCQGPFELFMSFKRYEEAREIMKTVYEHQYFNDGNWPQWFMFDSYSKVQQDESHGDIIVWPLRSMCNYILTTEDYDILNEEVAYTNRETKEFTDKKYTILEHLKLEYKYIKDNFIKGTTLSCYGDGDWDDTLQPANADLKKNMVSGWTVALTYETLVNFAKILRKVNEDVLAKDMEKVIENLKEDYNKYIVVDGITTGFAYLKDLNNPEYIIHPRDNKTGVKYRLLPMLRGMISSIFTEEQVKSHYELLSKELLFEDGIRLMSKPATYKGGVSEYFKRAEQASCFGREIGLNYIHAHIRYIEAMSKIGKSEDAFRGIMKLNSINVEESMKNAEIRQSNTYYSSSDGMFNDRYEAEEKYQLLKNGEVKVKGGWRIYSSGPGIYINQVISNFLGLREEEGYYIFDTVIPQELSGLQMDYELNDLPVTYVFTKGDIKKVLVNGNELKTEEYINKYKANSLKVKKEILNNILNKEANKIEIYF